MKNVTIRESKSYYEVREMLASDEKRIKAQFKRNLMIILCAIALFIAVVGTACDDSPTPPCANACGVTSPVTEVESAVQRMIQPEQDNILSGGN